MKSIVIFLTAMLVAKAVLAVDNTGGVGITTTVVRCEGENKSVHVVIHEGTGEGSLEYNAKGPNYAYTGFLQNDPKAQYSQSASFTTNQDYATVMGDSYETVISDFPECVKWHFRACEEYTYGPHPVTSLLQSFFLRLGVSAAGEYDVQYFSIGNAIIDLPGGYEFSDFKGMKCSVEKQ